MEKHASLAATLTLAVAGFAGTAVDAQTPEINIPTGVAVALNEACNDLTANEGVAECSAELGQSAIDAANMWLRDSSPLLDTLQKDLNDKSITHGCEGILDANSSPVENRRGSIGTEVEKCIEHIRASAIVFPQISSHTDLTDSQLTVIDTFAKCLKDEVNTSCEISDVTPNQLHSPTTEP